MHVVSTAGHVDHGKSTLVRALTGIDPDRLLEEQDRQLTIDLGFAWTTTPGGRELGFVDVPGHERFISNMLAGVGSVDATLFVVAANEGWSTQSEEHLQILDLLGARSAVVALTKADLVDEEGLEAAFADVRARVNGTCLAGADIVAVSAPSAAGVTELAIALDRMLDRAGEPASRARPRVYIDRAFTVQGVGTVVTGTLTGGALATGDEVEIAPSGIRARVRGIQTHRQRRERAEPVSRVALNLAGIERAEVARGDALVRPGQWSPTTELDVTLRAVRGLDHPVSSRGSYKVYVGTAEVDARVSLYDTPAVPTEGRAFARLHLTAPVIAAPFDRFVLRDTGRYETVCGGTILDAHPPAVRGAARASRPKVLAEREGVRADDIPTLLVAERGVVARADLEVLTASSVRPRGAVALRSLDVSQEVFDRTEAAIAEALATFHASQPLVRGMPREDARAAAGIKDDRLFNEVVAASERIETDGPLIRSNEHRVVLPLELADAREALLEQLRSAGYRPPNLGSLMDAHGEPLVRALLDDGTLVAIADDIAFASESLDAAKETIAAAVEQEGPLTASRIRQLLDTSRKFAIPLCEHLDAIGFTRRRGDVRELV